MLSITQTAMLLIYIGCLFEGVNAAVGGPPPPPPGAPPNLTVPRAQGPPPPAGPPPNLALGSGAVRRPAPTSTIAPAVESNEAPRPRAINAGGLLLDENLLRHALTSLRNRATSGTRRTGTSSAHPLAHSDQVDALVRQASSGPNRFRGPDLSEDESSNNSEWEQSSDEEPTHRPIAIPRLNLPTAADPVPVIIEPQEASTATNPIPMVNVEPAPAPAQLSRSRRRSNAPRPRRISDSDHASWEDDDEGEDNGADCISRRRGGGFMDAMNSLYGRRLVRRVSHIVMAVQAEEAAAGAEAQPTAGTSNALSLSAGRRGRSTPGHSEDSPSSPRRTLPRSPRGSRVLRQRSSARNLLAVAPEATEVTEPVATSIQPLQMAPLAVARRRRAATVARPAALAAQVPVAGPEDAQPTNSDLDALEEGMEAEYEYEGFEDDSTASDDWSDDSASDSGSASFSEEEIDIEQAEADIEELLAIVTGQQPPSIMRSGRRNSQRLAHSVSFQLSQEEDGEEVEQPRRRRQALGGRRPSQTLSQVLQEGEAVPVAEEPVDVHVEPVEPRLQAEQEGAVQQIAVPISEAPINAQAEPVEPQAQEEHENTEQQAITETIDALLDQVEATEPSNGNSSSPVPSNDENAGGPMTPTATADSNPPAPTTDAEVTDSRVISNEELERRLDRSQTSADSNVISNEELERRLRSHDHSQSLSDYEADHPAHRSTRTSKPRQRSYTIVVRQASREATNKTAAPVAAKKAEPAQQSACENSSPSTIITSTSIIALITCTMALLI